jgi:general secretion pathway protein J
VTPAATISRNAGFTLLEALVATMLMGLILAALATVTAQWFPSWDRGLAVLQRTELAAEGLDRVTDDLAEAEFITTGHGKGPPFFDGSALSVVFIRSKLAPNGGPGIEVVRLAEASSTDGLALVRSTATLPIGSEQFAEGNLVFADPVPVIHAPYRVSFSYGGKDRLWRDSWHAQPELPRAIRIQVRDNATSELLSVTTSTLIHADLAARCAWDAKVGDCPGSGGPVQNGATAANGSGGR